MKGLKNNIDIHTLEFLPVAVILFENKQIYFLNKKAIDLFKLPKSHLKELNKLSIYNFINKKFHKKLIANNKLILNGAEFPPIELECINYKKETLFVEAKSNFVFFNNKKVIQSTFLEINERVKRYNKLERTEDILNSISKSVKEIIYEFSFLPLPHISFISDSVYEMLGRKPEEIYKDLNIFLNQIHQDDKVKYVNSLNSYLKTTDNSLNDKALFRFFHKNGNQLFLEVSIKPKYNGKQLVSFIGIIRDITQEKNQQIRLEQEWNNYKNLLDTSPIGIFIHEGFCIYANKTAADILEIKDAKKLIGKNLVNYIIPEERQIGLERMQRAVKGEKLPDLLYTIKTSKGKFIEVELNTVPFVYNGKTVVQTTISNVSAENKLAKEKIRAEIAEELNKELKLEISNRQKIQDELLIQTTKYSAIFNNTSHLIWTVNRNLLITSFNSNYFDYVKNVYDFKITIGSKLTDIKSKGISSPDISFWVEKYNWLFKNKLGKKIEFFKAQNEDINGKTYYREIYLHAITDNNGMVNEVAAIAQDVTERIEGEKIIKEQSARLNAIFESGEQLMWTVNKGFLMTSFNQNFSKEYFSVFGFYPELGKNIVEIIENKRQDFKSDWKNIYNRAFNGEKIYHTSERITPSGLKIFMEYYLYPIKNIKDIVVEVSVIGFDITEKRTNEDKINESLKEKEILLKEVHHRVKNNMQVISSILNLQSAYVKDAYSLNLLKECQNRIKSMAFIHESLYQSKNFESVNFSEYISTLSKSLVHTYSVNTKKIKLILTLDKLFLNLDTSISCGLIINEIISNSLKYAFPNNVDGMIFVKLMLKNKKIVLEIGDNGVGIPNNINLKQSQTLGLQLVDTLVEQINGTINLDRINGTKFKIEFNK